MRVALLRAASAVVLVGLVAGCSSTVPPYILKSAPAELEASTGTALTLQSLPPPAQKVDVAVYDFPDRTGQFQTNDTFAENSRAVTQGAASILIDVLKSVGGGQWFEVIEREGVQQLLQERDIIQRTRAAYEGNQSAALPALRFAGTLIEGGVIAYDTNVQTGGAGANYLGIGANTEYRTDIVTVALRTVSVANGRVMTSVTTTKTVHSVLNHAGTFLFVSLDDLLQTEFGFSKNEPVNIAVREAIELAVLMTIVKGVEEDVFDFADEAVGRQAIAELQARYQATHQVLDNRQLAQHPEPVREIVAPPPLTGS